MQGAILSEGYRGESSMQAKAVSALCLLIGDVAAWKEAALLSWACNGGDSSPPAMEKYFVAGTGMSGVRQLMCISFSKAVTDSLQPAVTIRFILRSY